MIVSLQLWRGCALAFVLAAACLPGGLAAQTDLIHDIEPNDAPHEAIPAALPDSKGSLRIQGELDGRDQDAYRIVVDEDRAGRRIDIRLTGRAGAKTQLDLFDFSDLANGRGRIPEALTHRPTTLMTLRSENGSRPTRVDGLLLAPGVYVMGVSHTGGEGSYELQIDFRDEPGIQFVDDDNSRDNPGRLRIDRETLFWTQGETWLEFTIDESQAEQSFDWDFQTPAGIDAKAELRDEDDQVLLTQEAGKGIAVGRSGLTLEAGSYRIRSTQEAAGVQAHRFEPGAAPPRDGREVEPNDRLPNPIAFGEDVAGALEGADTDRFRFTVSENQQDIIFGLDVRAAPESDISLCLIRESIGLGHCRHQLGGHTALRSLGLSAGDYTISISDRKRVGTDWTLTWTEQGEARAGEEVEPNDYRQHAVLLHERGFGRGHFDGEETDYWRFSVTGEPQLWRAQLQGENIFDLTLYNGSGEQLASQRAGHNPRIRLDKLYLMPGEYTLAAKGTDSDYVLRLLELGPPPEGMEREPNDQPQNADRLRFGVEHFGTLAQSGDTDLFAFRLNGYEHLRIEIEPPVDGSMEATVVAGDGIRTVLHSGRREPGEAIAWNLALPPADYYLQLEPDQLSDAEYKVRMTRLDYLQTYPDLEPNDSREFAAPIPADGQLVGSLAHRNGAQDWYRLPVIDEPVDLELPSSNVSIALHAEADPEVDLLEWDGDAEVHRATIQPGQEHWLKLSAVRGGEYDYDLSGVLGTGNAVQLPLELDLTLAADSVQAFSPWAQSLSGTVTISNPSDRVREVELETHVTDVRWQLSLGPGPHRLEPGEDLVLGLDIAIPADVTGSPSAQLSVAAHDHLGQSHAVSGITVDPGAAPQNAVFHWPVPEALRGGLNAAWMALGAEAVDSPNMDERGVKEAGGLFDGLVQVGETTTFDIPMGRGGPEDFRQPTVRLAGDEPVPVVGFLLNPVGRSVPHAFLREFEVAVSRDGEQYETVLRGRLEPIAEEQAFVLDEPVPARYVRLLPIAPQLGYTGYGAIRLGEFKVVAETGWRPGDGAFNLADPDIGGHVVWTDPAQRASRFDTNLLRANGETATPSGPVTGRGAVPVVIGFHNNRAARIDRLSILPLADAKEENRPLAVSVSVAEDSPLGPWREVSESDLGVDETEFALDEPVWARFVRLTFELPDEARQMQVADRIAVFEAPGPSILGEWGFYEPVGPLEAMDAPVYPGMAGAPDNDERARAVVLPEGEPRPGRALLDAYSSWYRLDVPPERNRLLLHVSGRPTVEGRPRLFDSDQQPNELYPLEQAPVAHVWEAWVEPGESYWLEMYEPPRSVIFSWDTSASIGTYQPFIARALMDYARTIQPGRDEINLLPFGRPPLLKNWLGHSYPLMKIFGSYPHDSKSSDAEGTLANAALELAGRPGKKAVVLLTDAHTTTSKRLWPALHEGRPQVFALKLAATVLQSSDLDAPVDLMQDWARVRGGELSSVISFGALSHGFERAVARLKAPVDFSVTVRYEQVEDPEPATIAVVAGGDGVAAADAAHRGAIGIILDASGSMLKRIDGERRIDIAKAAIRRPVEESLPEGVPMALRVYGHKEAGSCRTDLEIPLGPLDKTGFLDRLDSVEAINLAKTPIADSLAAAASDLADAEGRRLVVLLTDGEETCDGDPAAAIEKLKQDGFDVRINIVGFAIDDDEIKRDFVEWAELGGGEYLDAGEAEGLGEAMTRALQVPYVVIDADGNEIARGLVDGGPVEVPPGRYTVRVEAATTRHFRDAAAAPGARLELSLRDK